MVFTKLIVYMLAICINYSNAQVKLYQTTVQETTQTTSTVIKSEVLRQFSALHNLENLSMKHKHTDGVLKTTKHADWRAGDISSIYARLKKLEALTQIVDSRMNDLVYTNTKISKIKGRKYLTRAIISNLHSKKTYSGQLNSNGTLGNLMGNLVKLNDNRQIGGYKQLHGSVSATEFRPVKLNNHDLTQYVRGSKKIVTKAYFLHGLNVLQSLQLQNASLYNYKVDTDFVGLTENITVESCTFKKLRKDPISPIHIKKINGREFTETLETEIKSKFFTLNRYDIQNSVTINGNLNAARVMGISSDLISRNLELKTGNHSLYNGIFRTVKASIFSKNMYSGGFMMSPVRREAVTKIQSTKFKKIVCGTLKVAGTIGGLHPSEIVDLNSNEVLNGRITFKNGVVGLGNLQTDSKLIDGIVISLDDLHSFPHKITVHKTDILTERITVHGKINGFDFKKVTKDLVLQNMKTVELFGRKQLLDLPNVKKSYISGYLNDLSIDDFVKLRSPASLQHITIKQNIFLKSLWVNSAINGKTVEELLGNKMLINQKQNLSSKFFDTTNCQNLYVRDAINSLRTDMFLSKTDNQMIPFLARPSSVVFGNIQAHDIWSSSDSVLNDIKLHKSFPTNLVASHLKNNIIVTQDVSIKSILKCEKLNGYDSFKILDVLQRNSPEQNIENIHFSKLIVEEDVTVNDDILTNVVNILRSEPIIIDTYTFWENVETSVLDVYGNVNGLNLDDLNSKAIFSDEDMNYITGRKKFVNGFHIRNNWNVKNLNGKNFRKESLTINTEQVLSQPCRFDSVQMKHLKLDSFNGKKVSIAKKHDAKSVYFKGPIHITGRPSTRSIRVSKYINGIDLRKEEKHWVNLHSPKNTLLGVIALKKLEVNDAELFRINGIPKSTWLPSKEKDVLWNISSTGDIYLNKVTAISLESEMPFIKILKSLADGMVTFNETNIQSLKGLVDVVLTKPLTLNTINSKSLSEDFLHKYVNSTYSKPWNICDLSVHSLLLEKTWKGIQIPELIIKEKVLQRNYDSWNFWGKVLEIPGNLTSKIIDEVTKSVVTDINDTMDYNVRVNGTIRALKTLYVSSISRPNSPVYLLNTFGYPFMDIIKNMSAKQSPMKNGDAN